MCVYVPKFLSLDNDPYIILAKQQVRFPWTKPIIKATSPNQQLHPVVQTTSPATLFTLSFTGSFFSSVTGDLRVNSSQLQWLKNIILLLSQLSVLSKWRASHLKDNDEAFACERQVLQAARHPSACHLFMEECFGVHTPTLLCYYCPITLWLDRKLCCVQSKHGSYTNTLKPWIVNGDGPLLWQNLKSCKVMIAGILDTFEPCLKR